MSKTKYLVSDCQKQSDTPKGVRLSKKMQLAAALYNEIWP